MVHAIPSSYRVDGVDVQRPVGVFGKNLEVETLVVLADSDAILSQTRVLKGLDFHITGLVYDGIATAQLYLSEKERQEGAVLFDIGGRHTLVSIYKDDILQDSTLIPIGGETFSRDIAECLKISLPEAERLKVLYGDVMLNRISSSQTLEATTQETGKKEVKTLLLCQILEARLSELLQLTQKQLPAAFEPHYTFVLGGGGGRLKGVVDYIEQKYSIHIRDGLPHSIKDSLEDTQYATSLGLILYALKTRALTFVASPRQKFFLRFKKWIGQFF
jgi:cell division protein FtsA